MPRPSGPLLALALAALAVCLFGRLSHPLLWQDEGETAMLAERVLAYGYPKVHGERNVVDEFGPNAALGVKESVDAYIGKTWGDFYFAVPGLVWSNAVDDPYARTLRLRLPFALAGAAGLAVMCWGVLPLVAPGRRRGFAAAFAALCSVSVSLLLHLREVRYYPLLVLVLGALLALHLRRRLAPERRGVGNALGQATLSFLVFQVFHVAWFIATALLALDDAHAVWRPARGRARRVARELVPHGLAALAVLPWLVFLETLRVARAFAAHVGLTPAVVLANLGRVVVHFARHELLLPALVCSAALAWQRRRQRHAPPPPARRVSVRLAAFCVAFAAISCLNPLIYERYFVVLSPLLTLVFLLDAFTLVEGAKARRTTAAWLLMLVVLSLLPRAPEIRGRLAELRTPVRGPIDFAVAALRERYPDTHSLVVATNYEAFPLMYYLGSRVIVGLSLNNIAAERSLTPDVVIPRRAWPRGLPELRRFLARARYEEQRLPVLDTRYNDIPSLSAWPSTPDPHRFETPWAGDRGARLRIFYRVRDTARVRLPSGRATLEDGLAEDPAWASTTSPSPPATSRPTTSSTPGRWASSSSRSRSGRPAMTAGPDTSSTTPATAR